MSDEPHPGEGGTPIQPRRRWTISRLILLMLVAGCLCGLAFAFFRAVDDAREAARCAQCRSNLKQIGLGLLNYNETWGCLPPAITLGPDGKPWHSWRMLILPHIESNTIYSRYRFDEPWDGPNNQKLHDIHPAVYACPTHPEHQEHGRASYVIVMGDGTAFPGPNQSTSMKQIQGVMDRTISVVESATLGPHWMEPRDLELARMSPQVGGRTRPGPSSDHPAGVNVVFLNGVVKTLPRGMSPGEFWSHLSIDGGGQDDRKGRADPPGD